MGKFVRLDDPKQFNAKIGDAIRKEWALGFIGGRELGAKYGLSAHQIKRIVRNEVLIGKMFIPKGNWKPITLHGNVYRIYDDGRVWSTVKNRELHSWNKAGYKILGVQNEEKKLINYRVHRLILELFDRPAKEGEFGRHLDDDRTNNHISNLAWGLQAENVEDGMINGVIRKGDSHPKSKMNEKLVRRIVKAYEKESCGVKKFAARIIEEWELDISVATIVRIFRGESWGHVTGFERRHIDGKGIPLDERAALAIHKNWNNCKMKRKYFCPQMASFLNSKGYSSVSETTVLNVLKGKEFPRTRQLFHKD